MKRRFVLGTMVMGAALVCAQAVYAAPAGNSVPSRAVSAKTRLVKFTLRNDSHATLKVRVGETEMSLEPGKPMSLALPEGQQIVAIVATPRYAAGEVLAIVAPQYSGNTVVLQ